MRSDYFLSRQKVAKRRKTSEIGQRGTKMCCLFFYITNTDLFVNENKLTNTKNEWLINFHQWITYFFLYILKLLNYWKINSYLCGEIIKLFYICQYIKSRCNKLHYIKRIYANYANNDVRSHSEKIKRQTVCFDLLSACCLVESE